MEDAIKRRILDRKWKALEVRGLKRPKDKKENNERKREAHGY